MSTNLRSVPEYPVTGVYLTYIEMEARVLYERALICLSPR